MYFLYLLAVALELGDSNPKNNTVVVISNIGDEASGGNPLICTTRLTTCCGSVNQRFGDWYYPNETMVPRDDFDYSFYRSRRDSVTSSNVLGGALLHRRFDAIGPTGIFHCVIPGIDEINQMLYVGLYIDASNGKVFLYNFSIILPHKTVVDSDAQLDPVTLALNFDPTALSVNFSLTCTSKGGPINTMQWEKDGVPVSGSSTYPDLTSRSTATYTNTLQVIEREPGVYTCIVNDGDTLSLSQNLTVEGMYSWYTYIQNLMVYVSYYV